MNHGISFPKRCLALLLAAILIATNFNGLANLVSAAEDHSVTVSKGEIVAGNYDLTAAEKALLESGLLAGGTITYTAPTSSDLIKIDTEEKKITVDSYTDAQGNQWIPTNAAIYVGEAKKEDVTLTDGVGTYTYGENAFSVKVTYALYTEIAEDLQNTLLGAAAVLKQGIQNLDNVAALSDQLSVLEVALPSLVDIAENGYTVFGQTAQISNQAVLDAIAAFEAQAAANGGQLDLSMMISEYQNGTKTGYLVNNGLDMLAEVEAFLIHITALQRFTNDLNSLIGMGFVTDQSLITMVSALKAAVDKLVTELTAVSEDPWEAAHQGSALVPGTSYAVLDLLVGELGTTTTISEIKNPLLVAETTVTLNMSMFDVTVNVVLEIVRDNAIVTYSSKSVKLTLAEGASAEEIVSAVAASGVENDALNSWNGVYFSEHFYVTKSQLPSSLNEDITYTITYSPKEYTVSYSYAESQQLPYGYELVLPRHEDATQAYDYTVNGVAYAQGATYTVVGDTTISREVGKAYTSYDLYSIIADNYGDAILSEMMKSGALKDNVVINVREPDPNEAESLIELKDGYLTAEPAYASDYEGLFWVPYSYGENGTENLFNGSYTVRWSGKSVKVQYILILDNYTAADVAAIVGRVSALKTEANEQLETLNRLASYYDTMGQLDKTKLGALNGVIGVTDFTPGDGTDTDAENLAMREYFTAMVGGIIANNLDSNNYLKIYNMLGAYLDPNTGGLTYYYNNYAALNAEIESLSGYLTGMLADEEKQAALVIMVTAAGYPEYAEKIENLATVMEEVKEALTPPNAMIDLESPNLYKLIDALNIEGEIATKNTQSPYLLSNTLTALDESTSMVQVTVTIGNNTKTFTSREFNPGETITQADVDALVQAVQNYAAEQLGANISFYEVTGLAELEALVGQTLGAGRLNLAVSYTAIAYNIVIDGMNKTFTVDINNVTITLPAHETAGYVYVYTVFDREVTVGQEAVTIVLTASELASISNGTYTITWYDYNKAEADQVGKLEKLVAALKEALGEENVSLDNGVLSVNLEASQLMDFVMTLLNKGGYSYYGLNEEGLVYMDEQNVLQVSIQTLINAVLSDEEFTRDNLIALGENGSGKLFSASLQLGDSATVLDYADMTLVINLSSVPAQMKTALNALKNIRSYLNFYSNNGVLEVELNLPDQVYAAYLTALVATGNVEKADVNAINQQIALEFMCDYLDAVINSGADLTTLQNTLEMLGRKLTLEQYNEYYKIFADSLTYEVLAEDGGMNMGLAMSGKTTIEALLNAMGMGETFKSYLGLIAEYKSNSPITVSTHVNLENVDNSYCALILDAQASGITNKIACIRTDNIAALQDKLASLAGYSVVILLSDVEGNLTINGTTVLDLNGHNVTGNIAATGSLYIIDSTMDTYNAGTVDGDVTGKVVIVAGNYTGYVEDYLKDGYYTDGTAVRNAMYYIEADEQGNITFVVNTDVYKDENVEGYLPDVRVIALDMVIDLMLNYATTAGLFVIDENGEMNTVYDICFEDLVGLLESRTGEELVNMLLGCVNAGDISDIANNFIADLLDFEAIYEALRAGGDGIVANYDVNVNPWMVVIERVAEGDYLTMSILSNEELAKAFSISLKLEGDSAAYLRKLALELAGIVEDETYVEVEIDQPTYDDKNLNLGATGNMMVSLDMSWSDDYAKMLGVILAYGNPDKAEAVAEAINEGNMVALKEIVDETTVAELFTALKVMSRNVSFAQMADAVGITVDITSAAEREGVYHLALVAAGKALEKLEITGMNSKFGNLYDEETGYYVLDKFNIFREGELNVRSYSASYALSVGELIFRVKLFSDHEHVFGEWIEQIPATCTEDGLRVRVCACGETEYETIPATGHDMGEWYEETAASCTEDGLERRDCSRCDHYETRVIEATGHSYEIVVTAPTCTEQGYTTYTCHCGDTYDSDYVDALGHDMGEWYEETAASCTEDGLERRDCSRCDHYETRVIEATGHSYEIVVTAPTCTEQGYTTYTCHCGDTYDSDYVDALGHDMGEWYEVTPATCTEDGETRRDCSRCDHYETGVLAAYGHDYDTVVTDPTCTEQGYTTYTCNHCGDSYDSDYVDALGHEMGEWYETVAPWCTTEGERRRDCERCDHFETETIDALGHNYVDGYCTRCGEADPNYNPGTGGLIVGGLAALMAAAVTGGVIVYNRRKKEDEEE